MTRIAIISDTHNLMDRVELPEADLLLHCGDWTSRGDIQEISQFNFHCGRVRHQFKHGIIAIAGNHDRLMESNPNLGRSLITNFRYLQDELIEIDGLKIYGAPWTPMFFNWAFMLERGEEIQKKWDKIPPDIDILMTHGPPVDILDKVYRTVKKVGCEELANAVKRIKPKLHAFGHIHYSYGTFKSDDTLFVNAATCGEDYKATNKPIVVEVDKDGARLISGGRTLIVADAIYSEDYRQRTSKKRSDWEY